MTVIVAVIVGFLTGRMLWLAMRKSWSRSPLMRTNYQGATLPTAAGIVLSLSLLLVEAGRQILGALGAGDAPGLSPVRAAALIAVFAFSVLGLLDDLIGTSGSRGFAGHTKALMRGELTSGMVKAIGGGAAAIVAAGLVLEGATDHGIVPLILDAGIIGLAANFFNLLDLRPGRSGKVAIVVFVLMALLAKFDTALVPVAIVIGAMASLILDDLHERLMLGDTGANAMGAAIGLGLATQVTGTGRVITFAVLLVLNLLSEVVSYTKMIDGFGPLRMLDNIGRRRTPPTVDVREGMNPMTQQDPFQPPFAQGRPPMPPFGEAAPSSDRPPRRGNVEDAPARDDTMDLRDLFNKDGFNDDDPFFGRSGDDDDPTRYPPGTGHRSDRI